MNKLIYVVFFTMLMLSSSSLVAQENPQETTVQLDNKSYEDQFTSATVPHGIEAEKYDIKAEKLNDLKVLTFDQFQYKYGYNSDTAREYIHHNLVNKVIPEIERKKREKEAGLEAERAIDSILWTIGISFFIAVYFIIKKYIPIFKVAIKRAAQKFQKSASKIKGNLNESRLKRKVQDTVIKEVVKQKIRSNVGIKSNVDKYLDIKGAGNSSINLTKLKQDINIALDNGEYGKAKELADLAEMIEKLN